MQNMLQIMSEKIINQFIINNIKRTTMKKFKFDSAIISLVIPMGIVILVGLFAIIGCFAFSYPVNSCNSIQSSVNYQYGDNMTSNPLLKGKRRGSKLTEDHKTNYMLVEEHIGNCIKTDNGLIYQTQGRFPNLTGKKIAFGGYFFVETHYSKVAFLEGEPVLSYSHNFTGKLSSELCFVTPRRTRKFTVSKRFGNGQMFLLIETNGKYDVYPVSDPRIYY